MTTTIEHADAAELQRKLVVILESLGFEVKAPALERYDDVRTRYRMDSSTMSMRIKRFIARGGDFPKETDPIRGRIRRLHVTPKLHELLSKPVNRYLITS
jgi:DNA-binding MarR family transcriptional regulator